MEKVDVFIRDITVFNSYLKQFVQADVSVLGDRIYYVDPKRETKFRADTVIDGQGLVMLPGFIDIHMHIESSMMTPFSFAKKAASCGVTTLVSEPHEMANVMGIGGVDEMIRAAKDCPIDIYYGIPSSVPSTNESLETAGGRIDMPEMKKLMSEKDVICVGEVMNYRQIVKGADLEITRFLDYLREENPQAVVEGHCPSLVGPELAKFLYRGIDADHTEHTPAEIKERFFQGMFVEIQGKMLKQEILDDIRETGLYEHCCFVTDDTMADELQAHGQLNYLVKKAVAMGFPLEEAVYCASYTPARRMNLRDRGSLAPGRKADFQILKKENIREFRPELVYKDGREIYSASAVMPPQEPYQFPSAYYHSVKIKDLEPKDFEIAVPGDREQVSVRVMEVRNGCTQTREKIVSMPVKDGRLQWQGSGCMLAMVLERHGKNGNIGYGFVTGCCLKTGAAATTYFHDHHNLMAAGDNPGDMLTAVKRLVTLQGGICTVKDGEILSELPLPIAGILSPLPADEIGTLLGRVRAGLETLGYKHDNPIMSLCTLGLPVSPALKLTDCGLVDVKNGKIVPLLVF